MRKHFAGICTLVLSLYATSYPSAKELDGSALALPTNNRQELKCPILTSTLPSYSKSEVKPQQAFKTGSHVD